MIKVATFEKVSFEEYAASISLIDPSIPLPILKKTYEDIILPKRSTTGSAGYDFFAPEAYLLNKGKTLLIPTGIRVKIDEGWMLMIVPRSGLGFKYRVQLDNTIGIIDSDYYYSDNEGHIFLKITCDAKEDKEVVIKKGQGLAQGIFVQYGITYDDNTTDSRNGGMGSTDKK